MMWTVDFSSDESPEDLEAWRLRSSSPANELPVGLPISFLLARTDSLALMVHSFKVYTTGLDFNLAIRLREVHPHEIFNLMDGVALERRLLLGVEYPDGRRAANSGAYDGLRRFAPERPLLRPHRGGGADLSYDQQFWLSPLPPDGPLALVCTWSAFGIDEVRHVVEDAALTSASSRVLVLWPRQPVRHRRPAPPPPELPTTGWFADAARQDPQP
jgi:hypothetical protein